MNDWVVVRTAENEVLAELIKGRLVANGLEAVVLGGDASSYTGASGPHSVQVPADQLQLAEEVLRD